MVKPATSATTQRLYGRLPAFYRRLDALQHVGGADHYPLLRYLTGVVDRAGEVETLLDRLQHVPADEGGAGGTDATSDLVDPAAADAGWLPWLAQLVGVTLPGDATVAARRDLIANAADGWQAGTPPAMKAAARAELTGGQYVELHDHTTTADSPGDAGQWDLLLVTKNSETDDVAALLAAARTAKPAGVELHHEHYSATWAEVESSYPTWADWHAAGTWEAIHEAS